MWKQGCVLVAVLAVVAGDTPANCTYQDVVGQWIFQVGEGGNDRTINCTNFGEGSSMYKYRPITLQLAISV